MTNLYIAHIMIIVFVFCLLRFGNVFFRSCSVHFKGFCVACVVNEIIQYYINNSRNCINYTFPRY